MKRGRPSMRNVVKPLIIEFLSDGMAKSINSIAMEVSRKLGKRVSWNTIQKYIQELIEADRIQAIASYPTKKGGKGLTVYILKK
jgi:fido (protein-threonine AMPylation protein)